MTMRYPVLDPTIQIDYVTGNARDAALPGDQAARQQNRDFMAEMLRTMSATEREILVRYYFREQRIEQICMEMNLAAAVCQLAKSKARTRFAAFRNARTS